MLVRNQTYIFIDIEAALIRGKQHIIEIGAVKWLPDGSKETFSQLIQPYKFKKLNGHIQQLTGITTEQLLQAHSFVEVMNNFINWCGELKTFITFGEFDRKVLEEELTRNQYSSRFLYPMIDFQQKYMIEQQMKEQPSLNRLMTDLNIEINIQHRALADAESLFKVFEASNGHELIEKQKTNKFSLLLNEFKQQDEDCHIFLTYLTGVVEPTSIRIESLDSIQKQLQVTVKQTEKILDDGQVETIESIEITPSNEVKQFLQYVLEDVQEKVLITRTGLRQLSKINRLHQCTIPKTEVMTLKNLLQNEEDVQEFTINGSRISTYEEKIYQLLDEHKQKIIDEFTKRDLFIKESVLS